MIGHTAFAKKLEAQLIEMNGCRCAIYLEEFEERGLQIDHRIPFEVAGDDGNNMDDPASYMLLCGSANRAKSWSCEHCTNWQETKDPAICRRCYWAYPEDYDHIAMRQSRRVDILWSGEEVAVYDQLRRKTMELQKDIPKYVKEIIEKHCEPEQTAAAHRLSPQSGSAGRFPKSSGAMLDTLCRKFMSSSDHRGSPPP